MAQDPSEVIPYEVFLEVLAFVPFQDVAQSCSRVNRRWFKACNASALWREYLYYQHIAPLFEPKDLIALPLSRDDKDKMIAKLEAEENGLMEAETSSIDKPLLARFDPWKKYFIWKVSYEHFRWMEEETDDNYHLSISPDRKTATLTKGKALHANCWGEVGYSKGELTVIITKINTRSINAFKH